MMKGFNVNMIMFEVSLHSVMIFPQKFWIWKIDRYHTEHRTIKGIFKPFIRAIILPGHWIGGATEGATF